MLVLSIFTLDDDSTVFDVLGPEGYESTPKEIGDDGESVWLDDVEWSQSGDDDFASLYPKQMNTYKNDLKESILYTIDKDNYVEILADDLMEGAVYFVKTDEKSNIVEFIDAERKLFLEGTWIDATLEEQVYDYIRADEEELKQYLDLGMDIEYEDESIDFEDGTAQVFYLGTTHEDYFVRELTYAVNLETSQLFYYDVINDVWESLE